MGGVIVLNSVDGLVLLLTALRVRSHWKIVSRSCVRTVLLALARSILLTPASARQLWYWSCASSACPEQRLRILESNRFPGGWLLTFCSASSSSRLLLSSCLLPGLPCSS